MTFVESDVETNRKTILAAAVKTASLWWRPGTAALSGPESTTTGCTPPTLVPLLQEGQLRRLSHASNLTLTCRRFLDTL